MTILLYCVKIAMIKEEQNRRYEYFKAFMFDGAFLDGEFGFPFLKPSKETPANPVSFVESRTKRRLDNKWLHFFAEDFNFECVWKCPNKYLELFQQFAGVITPDFSLYGDLPKAYQIWNCFRNRAVAFWLQQNGIKTIPTVSWADKDSFEWCFDGLPVGGTVAVSANGCYFNPYSRKLFIAGFYEMTERIAPDLIVCVGYLPKELKTRSDVLILPGFSQQRGERENG